MLLERLIVSDKHTDIPQPIIIYSISIVIVILTLL